MFNFLKFPLQKLNFLVWFQVANIKIAAASSVLPVLLLLCNQLTLYVDFSPKYACYFYVC